MSTKQASAAGRRALLWAMVILAVSAVIKVAAESAAIALADPEWAQYRQIDLDIYSNAVRNVLGGQYLYGFSPAFTYPPFALLALAPLVLLPFGFAVALFSFIKVFALHVGAYAYLGTVGVTGRRRLVWAAVAGWVGSQFIDPTNQDISHGQVNIILMALVAADLLRPATARWRGIGVGIAAGIKLVPGLFIVYLLVTRQFRAAAIATGAFAGTVALGFAVLPKASWGYWTSTLWDNSRVWEKPEVVLNQTVHGVVTRALGYDNAFVWVPLTVVVAVIGLAIAAALHRRELNLAALSAVGLTAAVVTPQGWIHHWAWVTPALLVVVVAVARAKSVLGWVIFAVLFTLASARPYYFIHADPWRYDSLNLTLVQQALGGNMVIALVILFGLAIWQLRRPEITGIAELSRARERVTVGAA